MFQVMNLQFPDSFGCSNEREVSLTLPYLIKIRSFERPELFEKYNTIIFSLQ